MLNKLKLYLATTMLLMMSTVSAQDIEDIYQQVLQSDPRLKINYFGVEVGTAREKQAFGTLLPEANITSSWSENKRVEGLTRDSFSGERYALTVVQPVFDMPRYYGWKRAQDIKGQFEFELKDVRSSVRLDTINRYFGLLIKNDFLQVVREDRAATEKRAEHVKALYEMQRVKITEFYKINARLDTNVSEEIDALQEVALAKEGLNELTNSNVEQISGLNETVYFLEKVTNIDDWEADSIRANYLLIAKRKAVDAAQRDLDEKSAQHYPKVALYLQKQKTNIGYENSEANASVSEVATLNLTIPLYSGGQLSAHAYEATQKLGIARSLYALEQRKIIKQTRDVFLGVNAIVRRVEAADKARDSAKKSYQAINRSFELGIATVSEVLTIQTDYAVAKKNHLKAKYEYIMKKAELLHLSGKLNDDFIFKISKWLL
tara:strand:- start:3174 stop:4472 length:1299 start_codon:yes stop_codon:yes gene_type:complete